MSESTLCSMYHTYEIDSIWMYCYIHICVHSILYKLHNIYLSSPFPLPFLLLSSPLTLFLLPSPPHILLTPRVHPPSLLPLLFHSLLLWHEHTAPNASSILPGSSWWCKSVSWIFRHPPAADSWPARWDRWGGEAWEAPPLPHTLQLWRQLHFKRADEPDVTPLCNPGSCWSCSSTVFTIDNGKLGGCLRNRVMFQ